MDFEVVPKQGPFGQLIIDRIIQSQLLDPCPQGNGGAVGGLKRDPQSMIYWFFLLQKKPAKNRLRRDIRNRFIILFWKYIK